MFRKSHSFKAISLFALLYPSWAQATSDATGSSQTALPSQTAASSPAGASSETAVPSQEEVGAETSAADATTNGAEAEPEPTPDDSDEASDANDGAANADAENGEVKRADSETDSAEALATEPKEETPYHGPATLLDGSRGRLHVGGYGGLSVHGTGINGTAGVLVGAEGAILLDHRIALGFAFHGLSSEVRGPMFQNGDPSILGFGYGGPVMRYQLMSPKSPVSLSVGALIGAGGLTLVRQLAENDYDFDESHAANAYFVAEPSAQVHLHLTRFMRIGMSGGYRFVRGPDLGGVVSDSDLEGVTAGGHLQFGWF